MPTTTTLLTTREVAERYAVPYETLTHWRMTGYGPAFMRLPNRRVRYCERDVKEFFAAYRTGVRIEPSRAFACA